MKFKNELRYLIRKPVKLIILILIASIFIFSFLLMILNFLRSKNDIRAMKDNYAQISTIVADKTGASVPEYQEIDPKVLSLIDKSPYVDKLEIRDTMSGKIDGMSSNNIIFQRQTTSQVLLFEGEILEIYETVSLDGNYTSRALISVNDLISAKKGWVGKNDKLVGDITTDTNPSKIKEGNNFVFIAIPEANDFGYMTDKIKVVDYSKDNIYTKEADDSLYFILNNGLMEDKGDLDKDFISLLKKETRAQDDLYTLRLVEDMSMIVPVAGESMFLIDGRFIGPEDFSKKVCVISKELATKHGLSIGDSLGIGLASEIYNNMGYVSAFPPLFEEGFYDFKSPDDYEIVGIFSYSNYHYYRRPLLYSFNDIFIPRYKDELNTDYISSYNLSFKVGVDNIASFEENTKKDIEDLGYRLVSADNNWSTVESSFESLRKSMVKNLILGLSLGLLGIFILVFINASLNKNDYTLRRIFAGDKNHIRSSLLVTLAISLVLGFVISFCLVLVFGENLLLAFRDSKEVLLTSRDYLYLILLSFGFIVLTLLINYINIRRLDKKDLVELIND